MEDIKEKTADEIKQNINLIEISKANIDFGVGESQTALAVKMQISEREKELKELQQYTYKNKLGDE